MWSLVLFLTANWPEIWHYANNNNNNHASAEKTSSNRRSFVRSLRFTRNSQNIELSDRNTSMSTNASAINPISAHATANHVNMNSRGASTSVAAGNNSRFTPPREEEEHVQLNIALQKEIVHFTGLGIQRAAQQTSLQQQLHRQAGTRAQNAGIGNLDSSNADHSLDVSEEGDQRSTRSFFVSVFDICFSFNTN